MEDQSDLFGEKELKYARAQFDELEAAIPRKERELESLKRKRNAYKEIIAASEPLASEVTKKLVKSESVLTVPQALKDPSFFVKPLDDADFDRDEFNRLARLCVQETDGVNLHKIKAFVSKRDPKLAAFPKLLDRCSSYLFVLNKRGEVKPLDSNHRPWSFVKTDKFRALQPATPESAGNEASDSGRESE